MRTVKMFRIKATKSVFGYYGPGSLYIWPKDDPDAMTYFGVVEKEEAFEFTAWYVALLKMEFLKKELPYFKDYGFCVEEFEKEVEERTFGGFVFPDGRFVYAPYMSHDDWVYDVYHKNKDDFMYESRCCEITTDGIDKTKKTIILPFDHITNRLIMPTEAQMKTILDLDLALTDIAKNIMRDVLE